MTPPGAPGAPGASAAGDGAGRDVDGSPGPNGRAQRARILAAATDLIATHGVQGMTMRRLAAACDLHIATLYHYFSSKSDLVGAIVDDRRYDVGLRDLVVPVDRDLPPRPRLEAFFGGVARGALGELRLWRMLLGESLRDDEVALTEVRRLSGALEEAVDRWLADLFPELDSPTGAARPDVTTVVTGQLLALFLEEMLLGGGDRHDRLGRRAAATAAVVFPDPPPR